MLQGGYVDSRVARIALQREVIAAREQLRGSDDALEKNRQAVRPRPSLASPYPSSLRSLPYFTPRTPKWWR